MAFEFSEAGIVRPAQLKIISFSLDQLKQTSSTALIVDAFQIFFTFCYMSRLCFVKIKIHQTIKAKYQKWKKGQEEDFEESDDEKEEEIEEEIDGYSPACSMLTDMLVVCFFFLKFFWS